MHQTFQFLFYLAFVAQKTISTSPLSDSNSSNIQLDIASDDTEKVEFHSRLDLCNMIFSDIPIENCTCDFLIAMIGEDFDFCHELPHHANESIKTVTKVRYLFAPEHDLLRAVLATLANSMGILGNTIVLAVYGTREKNLTNCKCLIMALASCDLFFAIIHLITVIPSFWTTRWIYGDLMCKLLVGGADMGASLAVGIIVIIALERYFGITDPLRKHRSPTANKKLLLFLLLTNLMISLAMAAPKMVFIGLKENVDKCDVDWETEWSSLVYTWVQEIFCFLLPVAVISFLYTISIIQLRRKTLERLRSDANNCEKQAKRSIKTNKRVMYLLICVLVLFVLLVIPSQLVLLVFAHVKDMSKFSRTEYSILKNVALIPYPFHVAANPIIYTCLDREFRKNLQLLLMRMCCMHDKASNLQKKSSQYSSNTSVHSLRLKKLSPNQTEEIELMVKKRTSSSDYKRSQSTSSSTTLPSPVRKEAMHLLEVF